MNKYLKKLFYREKCGLRIYIPKNIQHLYTKNVSYTYQEDKGILLYSNQYSKKLLSKFDELNDNAQYKDFMYDAHYNKFTLQVKKGVVKIPQSVIKKISNGCVNIAFNRDMIIISHIKNTGSKSVYVGADENGENGAWVKTKM